MISSDFKLFIVVILVITFPLCSPLLGNYQLSSPSPFFLLDTLILNLITFSLYVAVTLSSLSSCFLTLEIPFLILFFPFILIHTYMFLFTITSSLSHTPHLPLHDQIFSYRRTSPLYLRMFSLSLYSSTFSSPLLFTSNILSLIIMIILLLSSSPSSPFSLIFFLSSSSLLFFYHLSLPLSFLFTLFSSHSHPLLLTLP